MKRTRPLVCSPLLVAAMLSSGFAHADDAVDGDDAIESTIAPPPPPPEPDRVMRSKGAFITGVVLTSMGVLVGGAAGAMLGTVYATDGERDIRQEVGITSAVGAVALLGVGIPLLVWGAREPTLDNSAGTIDGTTGELTVAPGGASLTIQF